MTGQPEAAPGYGQVILEHYRRPRNRRRLDIASGRGEASNALCGDHVRFAIRVESGRIVEAAFEAEACAICTASASLLTGMADGLTPAQLMAVPETRLFGALAAEIRPARRRCVTLPLEAACQAAREVISR